MISYRFIPSNIIWRFFEVRFIKELKIIAKSKFLNSSKLYSGDPYNTFDWLLKVNDENNITVNVWERGAGLTKACGTAACATAVAAFIKKLTKNDINIKFEEGSLNIKIDSDLNIFMRGPVSEIKHTSLEI